MKIGDEFVIRIGQHKEALSELVENTDKVVIKQSYRHKVNVGQMWKVQIVDLSDNPKVYLVRPFKKINDNQLF